MSSKPNASHLQNATEHLGLARDHLVVGAVDAAQSATDAVREVRAEAGEDFEVLLDQGKSWLQRAGTLIGERPWAAVGGALAAGYVLAKFARGR